MKNLLKIAVLLFGIFFILLITAENAKAYFYEQSYASTIMRTRCDGRYCDFNPNDGTTITRSFSAVNLKKVNPRSNNYCTYSKKIGRKFNKKLFFRYCN